MRFLSLLILATCLACSTTDGAPAGGLVTGADSSPNDAADAAIMVDATMPDEASDGAPPPLIPCDPKNDMCVSGKKCCPRPQVGDEELEYVCVALRPPAESCPK